ncbi:MAG: hypothetical protein NTV94_03245 [Planctomycetota bacterium]|nr:hypothetical protein [Planctomycetota bacterium]
MPVIRSRDVGVALLVVVVLLAVVMVMPRFAVFVFIGTILYLIPYTLWRAMAPAERAKAPGCVPSPSGDVVRVARPMASDEALEEDQWGSLQGRTVTRIVVAPEHLSALRGVREGEALQLVREPENVVDMDAVAVRVVQSGERLGVVSRGFGKALAGAIGAGEEFKAQVKSVGQAGEGGVRVVIWNVRGVGE